MQLEVCANSDTCEVEAAGLLRQRVVERERAAFQEGVHAPFVVAGARAFLLGTNEGGAAQLQCADHAIVTQCIGFQVTTHRTLATGGELFAVHQPGEPRAPSSARRSNGTRAPSAVAGGIIGGAGNVGKGVGGFGKSLQWMANNKWVHKMGNFKESRVGGLLNRVGGWTSARGEGGPRVCFGSTPKSKGCILEGRGKTIDYLFGQGYTAYRVKKYVSISQ